MNKATTEAVKGLPYDDARGELAQCYGYIESAALRVLNLPGYDQVTRERDELRAALIEALPIVLRECYSTPEDEGTIQRIRAAIGVPS